MVGEPCFWVDGQRGAMLPPDDRGLLLADGVFETVWFECDRFACAGLHCDRLASGLRVLGFEGCEELAATAVNNSQALVAGAQEPCGVVRITVSRGSGPRGYRPPNAIEPRVVTAFYPAEPTPFRPLTLGWSGIRWSRQPLFGGNKLLARTEQVLAAQEAVEQGWDDALMCDDAGHVISASSANLLVRFGRELLTPKLSGVGIAGTRLRVIRESLASRCELTVREVNLTPEDLGDADELLLCNTVKGVQSVSALGAHHWDDHEVGQQLHDALRQLAEVHS